MRVIFLIILFTLCSCSAKYLKIKHIVQINCEGYIDIDDIKVIKKETYYVSRILKHPIYSNGYYFLVYGNNWDNAIMVVDNNKFYYMNDSLYNKIININLQLLRKGKEIEDFYISDRNSFLVRARDVEKKYQYKAVDIKKIEELLSINFEYADGKKVEW